jgi:hypothetical protein
MSVFVGLDCGGSSSRVIAVDGNGAVLFKGQSGAANLSTTPEKRLMRNLAQATKGCPSATYVCGCFAGLIGPETKERGEATLQHLFPTASVRAEPDFIAALYAAPATTDILIISGTGSLICSRTAHGIVKSGGRGYVLGDQGSGYQFGRDVLVNYLDNPDEASEALKESLLQQFGGLSENTIVPKVYGSGTPATTLARLAKFIGQDANEERQYAIQSIDRNLGALIDVLEHHIRKNFPDQLEFEIVLSGGVWKSAQIFRERLIQLLAARFPSQIFVVNRITQPPLYGALELAKEMLA